jgi:hypothetical protein
MGEDWYPHAALPPKPAIDATKVAEPPPEGHVSCVAGAPLTVYTILAHFSAFEQRPSRGMTSPGREQAAVEQVKAAVALEGQDDVSV